jgi:hypothetical protein
MFLDFLMLLEHDLPSIVSSTLKNLSYFALLDDVTTVNTLFTEEAIEKVCV